MMNTIVRKLTRGGYTVIDVCEILMSRSKAYPVLPCHRSSGCCDINAEYIKEPTSSLVLVFAKLALNLDWDIEVSDEVLFA